MSNAHPLVFVLEDEHDLAAVYVRALRDRGFSTESFGLVRDIEHRLTEVRPDVCIVDMCLPDGAGLDVVVRRLKSDSIPAIIVSGVMTEVPDRVVGLELGADDYLIKPIDPRELIARVRVVLRRNHATGNDRTEVARFSGWAVNFRAHCLTAPDGQKIELSASEVRLMRALATRPRRVQSRETLMSDDVAAAAAFDRSIDVRISRLRTKLREDPRNPQIIKTVYGAGYIFTPAVEWSSE